MINGRSLHIRRNCAYALRQLRSAVASTKYYWIDAISIDQSNAQERGHQVQMMARIFERAQQVAISYGIEDFETTSFTHMLTQLDALPSLHNNQPVRKGGKLTPEESAGLLNLIQSPYWSRMWIVQELAVAKSVVILTKDTTLPLPFVFRFAHTVRLDRWLRQATASNDDDAWSSFSVTDFDKLPMMTLGYSLNWQGSDMLRGAAPFARRPLHDTLDYYGDKLCEDVRDRIYAVISLVDWPRDLVQLTVDYNTTALQLALRVCMYDKTHSPHLPGPWQCASLLCDCLGITLEDTAMAVMMEERRQRLPREVLRNDPMPPPDYASPPNLRTDLNESERHNANILGALDLAKQTVVLRAGKDSRFCVRSEDMALAARERTKVGMEDIRQSTLAADGQDSMLPSLQEPSSKKADTASCLYIDDRPTPIGRLSPEAAVNDRLAALHVTKRSYSYTIYLVLRRQTYPALYYIVGYALLDVDIMARVAPPPSYERKYLVFQYSADDLMAMVCLHNAYKAVKPGQAGPRQSKSSRPRRAVRDFRPMHS